LRLELPHEIGVELTSRSQIARVTTEPWVERNFYCPSCGYDLKSFPSNTPVYDFSSPNCSERFQLKSSRNPFGGSVLGSEYHTTISSIRSGAHPSLILLHYHPIEWKVVDLSVIHRACITESCIIPRKPLSQSARRAGWQGCIISLGQVPQLGRVRVIIQGIERKKEDVLAQWKESDKLLKVRPESRGWLADVLQCVERSFATFTLNNIYQFEGELAELHPNNHNIRAKIRQQLQVLRDLGLVEFVTPGVYRYLRK
jgi:type II restriction enzyme